MANLLCLISWALPLLYLGMLIDYGVSFSLRTKEHARNPWLPVVIAVHVLFLLLRAIHLGYPPVVTGYEILSVLALSTTIVYAVVEHASRERRTGVFVFSLVFLFQYTSSVFLVHATGGGGMQGGWGRLHVLPAVLAYTGFTISAVYGLLQLKARNNLKQHRFGALFDRLPSLELLGRMSWYSLVFGFAFLTLAIATGPIILSITGESGHTSVWEPNVMSKIVIGSVAWVIYLVAVLGRTLRKWQPERVARIAVAGFVVIMIMIGVGAVLSP